jgi:hypothetical protein
MPQAAPAASDAPAPRLVEVCGQAPAWTIGDEYIPEPVFQEIFRTQSRTLRALSARFVQDSDLFVQAVGLSTQALLEIQDQAAARSAREQTGAPDSPAEPPALTATQRRLVDLAARSADARLYVIALPHCEFMRDPASRCDELSWLRAAELAPNNGYLWLRAAHEQRAAGNPQGEREALDHAIRSSRFETYEPQRSALVAAAALQTGTPFERLAMSFDLPYEGDSGDMLILDYATKQCSGRIGPAERQRCQQLADRLASTEPDWSKALSYLLGIAVAADRQRAEALKEELKALHARREARRGKALNLEPSCAAAEAHLNAVVASARRINSGDQPVMKERGQ